MEKRRNLLMVSLDTVRADVAYSGRFSFIEKLKNDSSYFTNAYTAAPLTPISHSSVFSGLYPRNHGVRHLFREQIKSTTILMPEVFKANGYKTFAVVSCPGMNSWYGFSRGFEHYDDEIPLLEDGSDPLLTVDVEKRGTALKRANIVADRAIQLIKENKDHEIFCFLHFFDAHWPYESPMTFSNAQNAYEEEIHFTLFHLKRVMDFLEESNLKETTDIIIFSDHGEDLNGWYANDKGGAQLGHPEEKGHGCLLYDQTMKVVLIIDAKEFNSKGEITDLVSLIDLMPTVCRLYNLKSSDNLYFDGVPLQNIHQNKRFFINRNIEMESFFPEEMTNSNLKLYPNKTGLVYSGNKIIKNIETRLEEIYNLSFDPMEKNNLLRGE